MKIKIWIFFLLTLAVYQPLVAQSVNTEFGKNRVQYHKFEWSKYETNHFLVYWYQSGRNIGESVVQMAELDHEAIRSLMEYRISDKIEILVYTDLTDLKQSNIGKDQVFVSADGMTMTVDNKMFVYFDGDHNHLRAQIRKGIASIYLNYMMYGGSFQEIVQNAVLLNLPVWFTEGLVSYVGDEWNTDLDNQLKDGILSGEYGSFEDVIAKNPRLAGHSFWHFIAQSYGKATVSNLLYLTRINRSVDNGFLYVLGTSFYRISKNWYGYYRDHYIEEANAGMPFDVSQKLPIKNKENVRLSNLILSPNGQKIAYVSNEKGSAKVWVQDVATGDKKAVFKDGYKNMLQETDYNYPLVAWSPNSQRLGIFYEKRDDVYLLVQNLDGSKSETLDFPTQFGRVLSFDFIDNRKIVFSSVINGYSDVYVFDIISRQSYALTSDYHDDVDVSFATINGTKGVIFSSNRDDSTVVHGVQLDSLLPLKTFDLYFYDLNNKKGGEAVRLTNTPYANERHPRPVNNQYYTFLSNESGIYNRYTGYIDTMYMYTEQVYELKDGSTVLLPEDSVLMSVPDDQIDTSFTRFVYKPQGFSFANTNYNRNIIEQHTAAAKGKIAELVLNEGEYQFYISDLKVEERATPTVTFFMKNKQQKKVVVVEKTKNGKPIPAVKIPSQPVEVKKDTVAPKPPKAENSDTGKVDIDNYFFQSEFEDEEDKNKVVEPAKAKVEEDKNKGVKVQDVIKMSEIPKNESPLTFNRSKIVPYRLQFKSNFSSTQLDNSQLFGGMEPYVAGNPTGAYQPLKILTMIDAEELFEDYRLRIGFRVPVELNGSEYFVIFDDDRKLLDKRYEFYRSRTKQDFESQIGSADYNLISNIAQAQFRYPLDIYQSVRATATMRFDQLVFESKDLFSLSLPNGSEQRIGARLEYVFDNTTDVNLNIKHGSLLKVSAEVHNRFDLNLSSGSPVESSTGVLGLVGFDARHYQKLDKHSIFATRLTAYSSFGSNKILYFMGGVNNWIDFGLRDFNSLIPASSSDEFVYQATVANLRGFGSNIRNGNNFALLNMELRVPIMKYLTKRNLTNSFVRNFQMIGFFDMGSAWEGVSPFREDNPLNTIVVKEDNAPVTVTVNYFRNPIVMGYGFGFRSTLLGYYVKLDYAWGVETGVVESPKTYFSIGMDF